MPRNVCLAPRLVLMVYESPIHGRRLAEVYARPISKDRRVALPLPRAVFYPLNTHLLHSTLI